MGDTLTKTNEIETITALAAKAFVRVLEAEKKAAENRFYGMPERVIYYDSLDEALDAYPEDLTWPAMGQLENEQPGSFAKLWERLKQYARDELESGQRAAAVCDGRPIIRARFLVLREKYIEEWQPRNVLESQMIDAICQAQTIREYWMTITHQRVVYECEIERYWIEVQGKRTERVIDGSESAKDAREEAERWDRIFVRAVRALRDLRRYTAPVIVNNQGGQVNVAAEGGQQVNVNGKKQKKSCSKGRQRYAKQLEEKAEGIRLKSASESNLMD
jgi:hypothetical protein